MISEQHKVHLSGHLLSTSLRTLYPGIELYRSQDVGTHFWVDILNDRISIDDLLLDRLRNLLPNIAKDVRTFRHVNLHFADLEKCFPMQLKKHEESLRYGQKFGGLIPAYEMDGNIELCS